MEASRFSKTPKLGIVIQITEIVPSGIDGRAWEVHDVERNRGFRVTLASAGSPRAAREEAIEAAIGLAIERALQSPPEKLSGTLYHIQVTKQDVHDSATLSR